MRWHSAIENTPLTSSQIPPRKWDVQGNEQTERNLPLEERCKTNYGKRHFGQLRERTDGASQNTLGELKCQLGFPKAFWMEWLSLMCLQGTFSLRFLQTVEKKKNQIPNPVNLEACIGWNTRDFCMMVSRTVATKSCKNWSGMRSLIPVFELWLRVDFKPSVPLPFAPVSVQASKKAWCCLLWYQWDVQSIQGPAWEGNLTLTSFLTIIKTLVRLLCFAFTQLISDLVEREACPAFPETLIT